MRSKQLLGGNYNRSQSELYYAGNLLDGQPESMKIKSVSYAQMPRCIYLLRT